MGGTVGDVLEAEGIEVGDHDMVAPERSTRQVDDGSRISVRFGRPLELSVDGETQTHWVTSTDVASALGEIGERFLGADLSTSRGAGIDREGMALEVVTPKKLKAQDRPARSRSSATLTALTAKDALKEMGVKVEKRDIVKPGREHRRSRTATRSSSPTSRSSPSGSSARPSTSTPSSARTPRCSRARPRRSAPARTASAT